MTSRPLTAVLVVTSLTAHLFSGSACMPRPGVSPPGAANYLFPAPYLVRAHSGAHQWLYGFIDSSGTWVVPPQYEVVHPFNEGLASVRKESRLGWVDRRGNEVVPPRFVDLGFTFSEGVIAVGIGDQEEMFADREGERAFVHRFRQVRPFADGVAFVRLLGDNKWSMIRRDGAMVAADAFDDCGIRFSDGLGAVRIDRHWGFVGLSGELAVPCRYRFAGRNSFGLAPVANTDGLWGYIDRTGTLRIPFGYRGARSFSEGHGAVRTHSGWGFIDTSGDAVVLPRYDEVHDCSEGLAGVRTGNRWGFVDMAGREVIPPRYSLVLPFRGRRAWTTLFERDEKGKSARFVAAYIDPAGRPVWRTVLGSESLRSP